MTDARRTAGKPEEGLPDGSYNVLVVDIAVDDSADGGTGAETSIAIEVVITDGSHKGEVVTVEFSGAVTEADALDALGVPGILVVDNGQPQLTLDEPDR